MRQLLKYLCEIEQNYAERVRACKQKDAIRAAEIIPDYLMATNINAMSLEGEWSCCVGFWWRFCVLFSFRCVVELL